MAQFITIFSNQNLYSKHSTASVLRIGRALCSWNTPEEHQLSWPQRGGGAAAASAPIRGLVYLDSYF